METEQGERLPSEPKLAKQLGVSRATLREAMRIFETEGLIRRQQGVGTFVVRPSQVLETGLEVLESIDAMAKRLHLPVTVGELKVIQRAADLEEADILNVQVGQNLLVLERVINVEDRPVAYLVDILPEGILSEEELADGFTGSVLDLLINRGEPELANSRCDIQSVAATQQVARALGIQRGDVLLKFVSQLITTSGQVIDYSNSFFLPGYFRFHVVRKLAQYSIPGGS